jgi:hypothetical protein
MERTRQALGTQQAPFDGTYKPAEQIELYHRPGGSRQLRRARSLAQPPIIHPPTLAATSVPTKQVRVVIAQPMTSDAMRPLRRVLPLLASGRPTNVAGPISEACLDSVNRQPWPWPLAYVREERLERVPPALANSDALTAVPFEILIIRVLATLDDAAPNFVHRSFREAVGPHPLLQ